MLTQYLTSATSNGTTSIAMQLRDAEHRLLRRRHRPAEPARRAEDATRGCTLNAVVTMFDSGGSSGQLRDELGVLPPGDVLKCALALARNEREARRVLLSRLPTLEHARLRRPHRRQPAAVDDGAVQRRLSRRGRRAARAARLPRPRLAGQRRAGERLRRVRRRHDARAARSRSTPGRASGTRVTRLWLEPAVRFIRRSREAIRAVRRGDHRPGQLLHEPDADLPRARRAAKRSGR